MNTAMRTENVLKHVHVNAINKIDEEEQGVRYNYIQGLIGTPTYRPLRHLKEQQRHHVRADPSTRFKQTPPRDESTAALSRSVPRPAVFLLSSSPTEEFNRKYSAPPPVLYFSRFRRTFDIHQANCSCSTTKVSTKETVQHWNPTPVLASLDIETRRHARNQHIEEHRHAMRLGY